MAKHHPDSSTKADLLFWEALDGGDPILARARHLYETTQALDEQIPWQWISGAIESRRTWRPATCAT